MDYAKIRKNYPYPFFLYLIFLLGFHIEVCQGATIKTIAGGNIGDRKPAIEATFQKPFGLSVDSRDNIYIADIEDGRIRKIDSETGIITTIAGNGQGGDSYDGGLAVDTPLRSPIDVFVDKNDCIFIAEQGSSRIRKVDSKTGIITTVAGTGGRGYSGDGGLATEAYLALPWSVYVSDAGHIYISDRVNHRVRKIDSATGIITTIAGNGSESGLIESGGIATEQCLAYPTNIFGDNSGNVYVNVENRIWLINEKTNELVVVAGGGRSGDNVPATSASLAPKDFYIDDSGNIYISSYRKTVRKVEKTTQNISSFQIEYEEDLFQSANLEGISGDSDGNIYFVDTGNSSIMKIDSETSEMSIIAGGKIVGDGYEATEANLKKPTDVFVGENGNVYIADSGNGAIRIVDAKTAHISSIPVTFPGSDQGIKAVSGDNSGFIYVASCCEILRIDETTHGTTSVAAGVLFRGLSDLHVRKDSLYIGTERGDSRIWRVDLFSGSASVIAGTEDREFSGDGNAAINATFFWPSGVTLDAHGNIYIADSNNRRIRKIDGETGIVNSLTKDTWDIGKPYAISVDRMENIYVSDTERNKIVKIDQSNGQVTGIAGDGQPGFFGDGGDAREARLFDPMGIDTDLSGNIYFADYGNDRVRKIEFSMPKITALDMSLFFDDFHFSELPKPGEKKTKVLTLKNEGDFPLEIRSITTDNQVFKAYLPFQSLPSLPAGSSYQLLMNYEPTTDGQDSGILSIASNDPENSELEISLKGTTWGMIRPDIEIGELFDFGEVLIGEEKEGEIPIKNNGNATLTISSIDSDNSLFRIAGNDMIIEPDETVFLSVAFSPEELVDHEGILTIISDDLFDSMVDIQVRGIGVLPPEGPISFDFNHDPGNQNQRVIGNAFPGRRVDITLHIMDSPEILEWRADLLFNPDHLRLVTDSFSLSDSIPGLVPFIEEKNGGVILGGTQPDSKEYSGSGLLGNVSFEVADGFIDSTEIVISKVHFTKTDLEGIDQIVFAVAKIVKKEVPNVITGDFDGDEVVDFQDFFLFADHFGTQNTKFDLDSGGLVDFQDFFLFADHFGFKNEIHKRLIGSFTIRNPEDLDELTQSGGNSYSISGDLTIQNSTFEDLKDLENLTSIGGNFIIRDNFVLSSFSGLGKLSEIRGSFYVVNNPLVKGASGLDNLSSIGDDLIIEENRTWENFDGLQKLSSIGRTLRVFNNRSLLSLSALLNLSSISNLSFFGNDALVDLDGMGKISKVADLSLVNTQLESLDGLDGLEEVSGSFVLSNNSQLIEIDGLGRLGIIGGSLTIRSNADLKNLNGFSNLSSIGMEFSLDRNVSLNDITGLGNLRNLGGYLVITNNNSLAENNAQSLADRLTSSGFAGVITINNNQ